MPQDTMSEKRDYYEVLQVTRTSSGEEIRRAYRKMARQYHPDLNSSDEAEERFKEINEAYEVLSDPEKRQRYDTLGENWRAGADFTPPPNWEGGYRPLQSSRLALPAELSRKKMCRPMRVYL